MVLVLVALRRVAPPRKSVTAYFQLALIKVLQPSERGSVRWKAYLRRITYEALDAT